jgi:hydrogenase expression/formation protein HypC
MCLAVPMQIMSLSGFAARCEARGVHREVSLFLLELGSVGVGDYVLVHVGYAIQSISPQDADASWALFDEVTAGLDLQNA